MPPTFAHHAISARIGQRLPHDEPDELARCVDGAHFVPLEVHGADHERLGGRIPPWWDRQHASITRPRPREPPGLLAGLDGPDSLGRPRDGDEPQGDRSLHLIQVAFDQSNERTEPAVAPGNVLVEQSAVGAVAELGRVAGLDPGREPGDAQIDGVAGLDQREHVVEEAIGVCLAVQRVVPTLPGIAAVAAEPTRSGPPVEPGHPLRKPSRHATAQPPPQCGVFPLGCVCSCHWFLTENVSQQALRSSPLADSY